MKLFYFAPLALFLTACGGGSSPVSQPEDKKLGSLPQQVIHPENNPVNDAKIELGKLLFWDPVLSGDKDMACATCHHPDHGYADGLDLSIGVGGYGLAEDRHSGAMIKRNAPTIINAAYNGIDVSGHYDPSDTVMFWDNRAKTLEEQAMAVLKTDVEMRGKNFTEEQIVDELVSRLNAIPEYVELFEKAFAEQLAEGEAAITGERIVQAIATFERTIVSHNSRFDQYARGDNSALTEQEIRGLNAFIAAGCGNCHSGPMFSDYKLHQLPIEDNYKLADEGIEDLGAEGTKQFRTPTLRNVALTVPYMHNGTEQSLEDAILFYDDMTNPGNDLEVAKLDFDEVEDETIEAIAAFLGALTDESFDKAIPDYVPSGELVGGNIY